MLRERDVAVPEGEGEVAVGRAVESAADVGDDTSGLGTVAGSAPAVVADLEGDFVAVGVVAVAEDPVTVTAGCEAAVAGRGRVGSEQSELDASAAVDPAGVPEGHGSVGGVVVGV